MKMSKSIAVNPLIARWLLSMAFIASVLVFVGSIRSADAPAKSESPVAKTAADVEADMVHRNGAIFKGWPIPKAAIVLTGLQAGYIEPCGCSGKDNQKGGLSRRDMLLQRLAAQKWPVVALDLGEQVRRFGRQQELKYQATADALKTMGYQSVAFGPDDLRLSTSEMFAIVSPVGNQPSPFVAANIGLYAFDEKMLPGFKIVDAGGMKIGIAAVLGDSFCRTLNNQDVQTKPAAAALKAMLPKLRAANCNYLVLLSHATPEESKALAKQFPEFNIVVTAGGAEEPPAHIDTVQDTKTQFVELGSKGKYAIVLGLFDDGKTLSVRDQRVPLDARFGESPRMKQALASYQDLLKELGLNGLGLKPTAKGDGRSKFVGSKACSECHTKAFAIWKKTPHAKALDTLAHLDPPRQFDPECLSCHVTGWEPQKFFPYDGGYTNIAKTPELVGNGCENCHGPGSAHVAAETGNATQADLNRLRGEMRLSLKTDAGKKKALNICLECHDGDNSIDFHGGEAFDEYWKKVEHHGKD
jgi:hypothetical protein